MLRSFLGLVVVLLHLAGKLLRLGLGEYQSNLSGEGLEASVSEYSIDSERVATVEIPPQALCRWALTRSR